MTPKVKHRPLVLGLTLLATLCFTASLLISVDHGIRSTPRTDSKPIGLFEFNWKVLVLLFIGVFFIIIGLRVGLRRDRRTLGFFTAISCLMFLSAIAFSVGIFLFALIEPRIGYALLASLVGLGLLSLVLSKVAI